MNLAASALMQSTRATPLTAVDPHRAPTLADRILDAFPAGSYALSGFLRLLDIVETERISTAAVECVAQPRLLINPQFVAKHASTSEKLLMLVMHELHHVLLGHTTLFPRSNAVQNFVFDSVINGICCRMLSGADFTRFFTDYYRADRFPECLLRPPPNWLGPLSDVDRFEMVLAIARLPEKARQPAFEVHKALYSEAGASYHEVSRILPRLLKLAGKTDPENQAGGSAGGEGDPLAKIPLLGEHGNVDGLGAQSAEAIEQQAPILFDLVSDLVAKWPNPPDPIRGRALSNVLKSCTVSPKSPPSNRTILRRLILRVAGAGRDGQIQRYRPGTISAPTPIPSLARRSIVLRALGVPTLLHPGNLPWPKRAPTGERVHIYLDVSGSMTDVLRALYGSVLDCADYVHPKVHLFSNEIASITLAQLRAGKCKTTGGTDIVCVARHMKRYGIRRAVLITDGYVGKPEGNHLETLFNARIAVAYLGEVINRNDLAPVANYTSTLNIGTKS